MSRFDKTSCSQCGGEFSPGDEGFSHCSDHTPKRADCLPVPTDRHQGWPGVYAVLYTDEINGEQTCRDDLWIATSAAIRALQRQASSKANALLIAAAPELLEALLKLANVFQEGQVFPRNGAAGYVEATLEAAEAVIAKATGGQS